MKKFFLLAAFVAALMLSGFTASAQGNWVDCVYLKNGSVIKGTITEQVVGQSLKIQTTDGSVFVYGMSEVEKITKEPATVSGQQQIAPSVVPGLPQVPQYGQLNPELSYEWDKDKDEMKLKYGGVTLSENQAINLLGAEDYSTFKNATDLYELGHRSINISQWGWYLFGFGLIDMAIWSSDATKVEIGAIGALLGLAWGLGFVFIGSAQETRAETALDGVVNSFNERNNPYGLNVKLAPAVLANKDGQVAPGISLKINF